MKLADIMTIGMEALASNDGEVIRSAKFNEVMSDFKKLHASDSRSSRRFTEFSDCFAWATWRWARCGFPLVSASHKLIASWMATSISAESSAHVIPPWPSFAVTVPEDFNLGTTTLLYCDLAEIMPATTADGGKIHNHALYTVGPRSFGGWVTTHFSNLLRSHESMSVESSVVGDIEKTKLQQLFCSRILLGAAIELENSRQTIAHLGVRTPKKRRNGEPTAWTFVLGRPVVVDVLPWARTAVGGGGKPLTVQTLVRGHWKRQACGPNGSDRKWIHIEPYWRGPEDAPINVRGHQL